MRPVPVRAGGAVGVFRRLRLWLTGIFALVAVVGLSALVALLVILDARYDRERVDAILRGEASRAAALVYEGGDGREHGDGAGAPPGLILRGCTAPRTWWR